jgi:hypothetical protein
LLLDARSQRQDLRGGIQPAGFDGEIKTLHDEAGLFGG